MDKRRINKLFKPKTQKEIYIDLHKNPTSRNYILWSKVKKN